MIGAVLADLRHLAYAVATLAAGGLVWLTVRVGLTAHAPVKAMCLASPVLAVGLVMFVRYLWGQNTIVAPVGERVDAEPAQPGQVDQPAGRSVATPARATVTGVRVADRPDPAQLPAVPVRALPMAAGAEHPTVRINPEWLAWKEAHRDDDEH